MRYDRLWLYGIDGKSTVDNSKWRAAGAADTLKEAREKALSSFRQIQQEVGDLTKTSVRVREEFYPQKP